MADVLISIVTPVLNGAGHIAGAIESVAAQGVPVEHIVIDGGSADGTVAILEEYRRQGTISNYVSEPDAGIADAFNKGIALSRGELIGILNADDRYLPGTLEQVAAAAAAHPGAVIHGDIVVEGAGRRAIVKPRPLPRLWAYVDFPFNHPAMFVPRELYARYGGYDPSYRLAMDFDFFLRLLRKRVRFHYVSGPLAMFSREGRSSLDTQGCRREVLRSQIANGLCAPLCWLAYLAKSAWAAPKRMGK